MTDDPNDAPSPSLPEAAPGHVPPVDERLRRWWGLRETPVAEAQEILEGALQRDGKRPFRQAEVSMASITASHLLRALEQSGFVLFRRPPIQNNNALSGRPGFYDPRDHGDDNV